MNMNWKAVIFDFDDTLYLKTTYEFIPNLREMLATLQLQRLTVGLLTYNTRALSILKSAGLDKYFDFIIMMTSKHEYKSKVTRDIPLYKETVDKREILFFDNDPFNVYDMETLGITSFLINPITGISKDMMDKLLVHDYKALKSKIVSILPRTYNYVQRTTYSQHLQILDRIQNTSRYRQMSITKDLEVLQR